MLLGLGTLSRVLVVEDDPNLRTVIRMVLQGKGHDVAEAIHGGDALNQMAGELPDVVVADMKMPIVTGAQLMQRMRDHERLRSIPVVIITGTSDARFGESQADVVLIKPFEPTDLLEAIERLTTTASAR